MMGTTDSDLWMRHEEKCFLVTYTEVLGMVTGKDGQNLQGKWSPYFAYLRSWWKEMYDKNKEGNNPVYQEWGCEVNLGWQVEGCGGRMWPGTWCPETSYIRVSLHPSHGTGDGRWWLPSLGTKTAQTCRLRGFFVVPRVQHPKVEISCLFFIVPQTGFFFIVNTHNIQG